MKSNANQYELNDESLENVVGGDSGNPCIDECLQCVETAISIANNALPTASEHDVNCLNSILTWLNGIKQFINSGNFDAAKKYEVILRDDLSLLDNCPEGLGDVEAGIFSNMNYL